jgi:hypothetical protein
MKPGKYDKKHSILIAGAELLELKRHTWMMPKALVLTDASKTIRASVPWVCIAGIWNAFWVL